MRRMGVWGVGEKAASSVAHTPTRFLPGYSALAKYLGDTSSGFCHKGGHLSITPVFRVGRHGSDFDRLAGAW